MQHAMLKDVHAGVLRTNRNRMQKHACYAVLHASGIGCRRIYMSCCEYGRYAVFV